MRGDSSQHEIDEKELDSDLQKVIQELTRFRDQVNILFAEEEKREMEEGEKSPLDQEKVIEQLDQSVNEMVYLHVWMYQVKIKDYLHYLNYSCKIAMYYTI